MDSWWVPCRRADCAIHNVEVTAPEHLSSPLAPRHPALEAHSTAPRPHVPVPGGRSRHQRDDNRRQRDDNRCRRDESGLMALAIPQLCHAGRGGGRTWNRGPHHIARGRPGSATPGRMLCAPRPDIRSTSGSISNAGAGVASTRHFRRLDAGLVPGGRASGAEMRRASESIAHRR